MIKKIIGMFFATMLVNINSNASFLIKMPLEIPQGGGLPYNSIIIGKDSSEPVFDVPDPLPTDEGVTCSSDYWNIDVYIEGKIKNEDGIYVPYSNPMYYGLYISNGFKGAEVEGFGDPDLKYYEICFKGDPIFPNKSDYIPTQEWDQDDCRYTNQNPDAPNAREYTWNTVLTSDGKRAFSSAKLGSFGNITSTSSGIIFPQGTITVPEGKILPDNNQRIIMGNVAFNRGNYQKSRNLGNNVIQGEYEVCKKTAISN